MHRGRGRQVGLWLAGVGLTWGLAGLGYALALVPGVNHVGPLACSIVLAVVWRHVAGYPERLRPGIQFSARRLLRWAIVLAGAQLNLVVVVHNGLGLLLRDAATIVFALGVMGLLARWAKADGTLSFLLGVGTGVCGASAIAAVSPVVKAADEDTALAAGMVAVVGTVAAVLYTVVHAWLPLAPKAYGLWCGISLHEVAQVALAAAPAGNAALALALLAKLGRVFLLVPLTFLLMLWQRRRGATVADDWARPEFPWFLLGFVAVSAVVSTATWAGWLIPAWLLQAVAAISKFWLAGAMVGLGFHVHAGSLRGRALRPLLVLCVTSLLLSLGTYWTV
ncbi:MAG: putative sulfate exporter family transporter [Alicyclobacillus sp.]|nr:putative sulfate exporter family transporter [Alicyclobacillus sp.]